MLSLPVLRLVQDLLNKQQLNVNAADFGTVAVTVIQAKQELATAIETAEQAETEAAAGSDGEPASSE